MITKTYIAKAIEATKNQSTQQVRGLLDQSSKNVIVDRQILARIVRSCVSEARPFSLRELERLIPGDIKVSSAPVFRDDAAAAPEDPGAVRQENTEDGSVREGVVHFDILFTLRLPGAPEPILLVINVEIQNRENLSYPLESRAVLYACRLVGRQGADYADIKKVYSVWIVTNPEDENDQNTERTLVVATRKEDGSYEAAPETARLFEVHFLYLGETKDAVEASVIRMLDIIFSKQLDVKEKKDQLEAQFGIRMSAEVTREMEVMLNTELALESIARKEGMLEMGLAGRLNREVILQQLGRLYKDPKEAQAFFDAYVAEHPQEAAYLKN